MSDWITVYSFPISRDLSALFRFIQRYQLPLRIAEEKNRQLLLTSDAQIVEVLQPLLNSWESGQIDLDRVQLQKAEPAAPQSPGLSATHNEVEWQREREVETGQERPGILPAFPLDKTPVSLLLIALCFFGWFLQTNSLSSGLLIYPDADTSLLSAQSSLAWHLQSGELWRLWTPAIVHFSFLHALFNALGIWILGRPLEARGGPIIFVVLVLLGGIASNLFQYTWEPGAVFGGMSGVVYALVGFVLVVQRWQPAWRDIPSGIITVALVWLILCALGVLTYFTGVRVANAAHLGGFITGLMIALVYCVMGGARKFNSYPASI
ncbi:rhomboid family intramembrane serine protease [Microbulbifer sp. OS29]|uniref:Rhomboid family intramembrane serine protease n=1 Tax=Microbulbifer okhotskensis TaxID=2926617 RepID=A0A9X2EKN3_9GAMM|nr:rhomboid family intramembrane serine protease [Microbulbifer okhotskensis]MCO1333399.1 rhomboid family intramembrane serine protease [Microbulbifer okhotskensis]